MVKGMTATLKFSLSFETKYLKNATITIKDYKAPTMYTITKQLSDCNVSEKSLTTTLSAEETLGFEENNKVKIQLVVYLIDGTKLASDVFYKPIKELLD